LASTRAYVDGLGRTATSLITFGFTIYKFFQYEVDKNAPIKRGLLTSRDLALIIVSVGLVCLVLATLEHVREVRPLRVALQGRRSLAQAVAWFISTFGILVLVSTILRQ
jgi:putative membrane protein